MLFLLFCLLEMRESRFTAQSLRVLFQNISPEKIFDYLKGLSNLYFWMNLNLK